MFVLFAFFFLFTGVPTLQAQECTESDQPCNDGNECTTNDHCVCTLRPPPPDEGFETEPNPEEPPPVGDCSCIGDPIPDCPHPGEEPPTGEPPPPVEGAPPPEGLPSPPEPPGPEGAGEPHHLEGLPPHESVPSPPLPTPSKEPRGRSIPGTSVSPGEPATTTLGGVESKNLLFCFSDSTEAVDLSTCNTTMLINPCPVVVVDEAMQVMSKEIDKIFGEFKKGLSRKKCAALRRQMARYIQGLPAEETPLLIALKLPEKDSKELATYKSIEKENLPNFSTCLKTGDMVLNDDKAALKIGGLSVSERPTIVIASPGSAGGCSFIRD